MKNHPERVLRQVETTFIKSYQPLPNRIHAQPCTITIKAKTIMTVVKIGLGGFCQSGLLFIEILN